MTLDKSKTYKINVVCNNCMNVKEYDIPCGQNVDDFLSSYTDDNGKLVLAKECEYCGCYILSGKGIVTRFQ